MITFRRCLSSILAISVRFSFNRNEATSTGTCTCTAAVPSFIDSSWMIRRICSAELSVSRMWPWPPQRGQGMDAPSDRAGRRRWRLISIRPNLLMVPNCTRARSCRSASRRRFLDLAAVLRLFHVDEVDDDQAAQVAQAHLARHFVGGFQVGARCGFLDVAALDGAGRVDVDRHQRLGVVDHDHAADGSFTSRA
jgi:hypothetical protein